MKSPYILVGITILMWSLGAYLMRLVTLSSPYMLTFLSFCFTFVVLGIYFGRQSLRTKTSLWQHFRWEYCVVGTLGYAVYTVPQLWSYKILDNASEAAILNYTWPIFATIFAAMMYRQSQKRTRGVLWIESIALLVGFGSVAIVATKGAFNLSHMVNLNGVVWGLVAGAAYGIFSAYSARINAEQNPIFLLCAIVSSIVVMVPFVIEDVSSLKTLTLNDILVAALLGGGLNGLAYISWTTALNQAMTQGISVSRIVSSVFVLPLLTLVVVTILLKESFLFEPYFIVGLVLVIISSVFAQRASAIAQALGMD